MEPTCKIVCLDNTETLAENGNAFLHEIVVAITIRSAFLAWQECYGRVKFRELAMLGTSSKDRATDTDQSD